MKQNRLILTEAQFLHRVKELAHFLGWLTYHTYDSRGSEPGFPDLVLCHPSRGFLITELKTDAGVLRACQKRWLLLLQTAGIEVHVWRPKDWEAIVSRLSQSST